MLTLSVMCLLGLGITPAVAAQSPPPLPPPPGPPYPDPVEGVRVYDYAGVLRDDTLASVEANLDAFKEISGVEIVVYTQVKPESDTLEEAACDAAALLEQWSMGRGGRPYGLVVLFDLDASLCHGQVQFYARPDIGVSGLTDTERQAIFEGVMLPDLRECDFDAALTAAMEGISAVEAGPVVLGGRIEVAEAGVAVAFPPGWYAFDLTHPDLLTAMGSFDENTAGIAPMVASISYERAISNLGLQADDPEQPRGADAVELLVYSQAAAGAGAAEGACHLTRMPSATGSVEDENRWMLDALEAPLLDVTKRVVLPTVELAGGRMARSEATALLDGEELHAGYFLFLHNGWTYMLQCVDSRPHRDEWLSIAETFEFLPVEEADSSEEAEATSDPEAVLDALRKGAGSSGP